MQEAGFMSSSKALPSCTVTKAPTPASSTAAFASATLYQQQHSECYGEERIEGAVPATHHSRSPPTASGSSRCRHSDSQRWSQLPPPPCRPHSQYHTTHRAVRPPSYARPFEYMATAWNARCCGAQAWSRVVANRRRKHLFVLLRLFCIHLVWETKFRISKFIKLRVHHDAAVCVCVGSFLCRLLPAPTPFIMVLGVASRLDVGGDDVVGAAWGAKDMLLVTTSHAVRVFKVRCLWLLLCHSGCSSGCSQVSTQSCARSWIARPGVSMRFSSACVRCNADR